MTTQRAIRNKPARLGACLMAWLCTVSYGADVCFDFEGTTSVWQVEAKSNLRGVHTVELSKEKKKKGKQSLMMTLDLNGSDPAQAAGEIFMDLRVADATGQLRGIDLRGKRIEVMVYAPTGADGEMARPNGLQVFAKDDDWRSQYGEWNNIRSGRWLKLTFTPSAVPTEDGYVATGFEPGRIATVGLRVLVPSPSKAIYQGPMYVDEVSIHDL